MPVAAHFRALRHDEPAGSGTVPFRVDPEATEPTHLPASVFGSVT